MKRVKRKKPYTGPRVVSDGVRLEKGLLVYSGLSGGGDITGEPIDWDEEIIIYD